ncbi:MAG TPA: hypothetical protein VF763_08345 [Candidatus Limnocylindrales bacterium]
MAQHDQGRHAGPRDRQDEGEHRYGHGPAGSTQDQGEKKDERPGWIHRQGGSQGADRRDEARR